MKALTRPQLDALLSAAKSESFMDWLMFLVTFSHGLRVSETLSLTKANIRNGYITVERGKGSMRCEHPLLPTEREHLEVLAGTTDGRLFPVSRTTFWRRMQQYGAKAGLPDFLRHPHALKHTTGRLGFKHGMTIPQVEAYLGYRTGQHDDLYKPIFRRVRSSIRGCGGRSAVMPDGRFFYEDMSPEDRPFCPPLRHEDDPEPFFRGGGQPHFLTSDGRIVDENRKPTWWFSQPPDKTRPLKPQPTFADPMDAAVALFMNDDAWYMGHAYLDFDWRKYLCGPTTQR